MKLAALAGVVALAAGCGGGSPESARMDSGAPVAVPAAAAPAEAEPKLYELWFGSEAGLTLRHVRFEPAPRDEARAVLESLLLGTPDSALHVGAPLKTPVRRVDVSENVATVDLGAEFEQARDRRLALAQIVYTLTQFPDIEQVAVTVAGESIARRAGRADFEDLLAPVVVEEPAGGAEIRSPLRVSGAATSHSGNVTLRLVTGNGRVLAQAQATVDCGSRCRGRFSAALPYEVTKDLWAEVVVTPAGDEPSARVPLWITRF